MKKQLLLILVAFACLKANAQIVASPSWSIIQNPSFPTVMIAPYPYYMDAVDANVMWSYGRDAGAGGANYCYFSRTINGGTSFNSGPIYPNNDTSSYVVANIEGIDANTAWVGAFSKPLQAQGSIFRTTNGGTSWQNMTAPGMFTNTNAFCDFVTFVTPSIGVAVGDPVNGSFEIWRTVNGGTNFSLVPNVPAPLAGEYGIVNYYCKQGTSNIWFGTQKGRVYRSFDGGQTWSVSPVAATTYTVVDLAFTSQMTGMVIGYDGTTLGIYNTTNGGATWNQLSQDPNMGTRDICEIPGTGLLASCDYGNTLISYSSDNGVTWSNSWGGTQVPYWRLDFSNNITGWAGCVKYVAPNNTLTIGSGTSAITGTFQGLFKYSGITANSNFSIPQNVCNTGSATLTPVNSSSAASGPITYSWTSTPTASFSSPTASAPVITFTANGTYTIKLSVINAAGTSTSSQIVTVLACSVPVASLNAPSNVICNNANFTFTNNSTGAPSPTINISVSPANNVTITQGSGSLYSMKCAAAGVYTLTLSAANITGSNAITQTINITSCVPSLSTTPNPGLFKCVGDNTTSVILMTGTSVPATNGNITYQWSGTPPGLIFIPINQFSTTLTTPSVGTAAIYTITLKATNLSGSTTAVQQLTIDACTGIVTSGLLDKGLTVYPIPAHDILNINLPSSNDGYSIKLVNLIGEVVYQEKNIVKKERSSLNVSNLVKGVYFLSVEGNNEKVIRKVIIE